MLIRTAPDPDTLLPQLPHPVARDGAVPNPHSDVELDLIWTSPLSITSEESVTTDPRPNAHRCGRDMCLLTAPIVVLQKDATHTAPSVNQT